MKSYDLRCPICGTVNRGLYLEETDGWMECEKCGNVTQSMEHRQGCCAFKLHSYAYTVFRKCNSVYTDAQHQSVLGVFCVKGGYGYDH